MGASSNPRVRNCESARLGVPSGRLSRRMSPARGYVAAISTRITAIATPTTPARLCDGDCRGNGVGSGAGDDVDSGAGRAVGDATGDAAGDAVGDAAGDAVGDARSVATGEGVGAT